MTPNTPSRPRASRAIAAKTEESIPPDKPKIIPDELAFEISFLSHSSH